MILLPRILVLFDEKQFENGLQHDMLSAKESIVLFSGYVTPARVSKLGDILRSRTLSGIAVRCVTRPPKLNGSIPEEYGREAIQMLEGIGVEVDFRAKIHQKVCLIDNEIVWLGSVNALSHMGRSDEVMTRIKNQAFAKAVAVQMSKRRIPATSAHTAIANPENPRCESCGNRSVYKEGRHGPYFECETPCGWKRNMNADLRRPGSGASSGAKRGESRLPKEGPPCPKCGERTRLRHGRYGSFHGCVRYPTCDGVVNGFGSLAPAATRRPPQDRPVRRRERGLR